MSSRPVRLSFRIPENLKEALLKEAVKEHRNMNTQLIVILEDRYKMKGVEENEKKRKI